MSRALDRDDLTACSLGEYERRWRSFLMREIEVGLRFRRLALRMDDTLLAWRTPVSGCGWAGRCCSRTPRTKVTEKVLWCRQREKASRRASLGRERQVPVSPAGGKPG